MIIESTFDNKTMPTGTIRVTLTGAEGVIKQSFEQDIDSFVINHWNSYVFGIHTGAGGRLNFDAGGGSNAYNSIIVGSGSAPVAYGNTALDTQILHGDATGRLAAAAPTMSYNTGTGQATITRAFTNNGTVAGVVVNECGIRVNSGNSTSSTGGLLIVRDVLSAAVTVFETDTITITYTIQLPYGANNYHRLFTQHLIARNNDNMALVNQSGSTVDGAFGAANDALNFTTELMRADRGIVVGTSSTAASFADITMGSLISNGNASGELIYGTCLNTTVVSDTTASNFSQFYLIRYYENRSGSNVTINEVGLVSNATINSTNQVYLFDRRVLPSPVEVADNTIVTAVWKFSYQF